MGEICPRLRDHGEFTLRILGSGQTAGQAAQRSAAGMVRGPAERIRPLGCTLTDVVLGDHSLPGAPCQVLTHLRRSCESAQLLAPLRLVAGEQPVHAVADHVVRSAAHGARCHRRGADQRVFEPVQL